MLAFCDQVCALELDPCAATIYHTSKRFHQKKVFLGWVGVDGEGSAAVICFDYSTTLLTTICSRNTASTISYVCQYVGRYVRA